MDTGMDEVDYSEESLLSELRAYGLAISSVSDLWNAKKPYRDAVAVLEKYFLHTNDIRLKDGIARALSVPWAKSSRDSLLRIFATISSDVDPDGFGLRWTIGNALEVLYDDNAFDQYVAIAENIQFGKSRQMVVLALAKSKNEAARDVLRNLTNDADVDGHAIKALAKLGPNSADRPYFAAKESDSRSWVAAAARRGLRKLDASKTVDEQLPK
jgi:hypothetical protein